MHPLCFGKTLFKWIKFGIPRASSKSVIFLFGIFHSFRPILTKKAELWLCQIRIIRSSLNFFEISSNYLEQLLGMGAKIQESFQINCSPILIHITPIYFLLSLPAFVSLFLQSFSPFLLLFSAFLYLFRNFCPPDAKLIFRKILHIFTSISTLLWCHIEHRHWHVWQEGGN